MIVSEVMLRKSGLLIICQLLFFLSISAQDILFVGNSLSYSNDMPQMLEKLAKDNGFELKASCICKPNYGLEDHLNEDLVETELKRHDYQFLIFQQGPSSQAYGRQTLFDMGQKLVTMALENKAAPAYLMVWPSKAYYQTFDGVVKNHTEAAQANHALLIPVGAIWQRLNKEHPAYKLYGPDGFHPSNLGSFLEALIILKSLHPDLEITNINTSGVEYLFNKDEAFKEFLEVVNDYLNGL